MRCHRHPERAAVGLCKCCNKGLCAACAVDGPGGLSCPGDCRESVDRIESSRKRSQAAAEGNSRMAAWISLLVGAACCGFAAWWVLEESYEIALLAALPGLVLLVVGIQRRRVLDED